LKAILYWVLTIRGEMLKCVAKIPCWKNIFSFLQKKQHVVFSYEKMANKKITWLEEFSSKRRRLAGLGRKAMGYI
jgi:hypothetical protein